MSVNNRQKWGFLRENNASAIKAGIDKDSGLHRTGLEDYLTVIFPNINDWVHNKQIPEQFTNGRKIRNRPDYRSENLKLIIEFDGLQHYTKPDKIKKDKETTILYESLGYKVVRIPYFIQLTNASVKKMFGREVEEMLFDENLPSLSIKGLNTPAYLCPAGAQRMKEEFKQFPIQYEINKSFLEKQNDPLLTGIEFI